MIHFAWPYPPSVNRMWRTFRGRMILSAQGREYRKVCAGFAQTLGLINTFSSAHRLSVHVQAQPPDRRKRDLDNVFKGLLDSLQSSGIIPNDEQIDRLCILRMPPVKEGLLIISIEAIP